MYVYVCACAMDVMSTNEARLCENIREGGDVIVIMCT